MTPKLKEMTICDILLDAIVTPSFLLGSNPQKHSMEIVEVISEKLNYLAAEYQCHSYHFLLKFLRNNHCSPSIENIINNYKMILVTWKSNLTKQSSKVEIMIIMMKKSKIDPSESEVTITLTPFW